MFRPTICAFALGFVAQPAVAAPPAPIVVEREGYRFEYVSQFQSDGSTIRISGTMHDSRDRFDLKLRPNGLVSGRVGYRPVRYYITRAARDRIAAQLKQRDKSLTAESALTVSMAN